MSRNPLGTSALFGGARRLGPLQRAGRGRGGGGAGAAPGHAGCWLGRVFFLTRVQRVPACVHVCLWVCLCVHVCLCDVHPMMPRPPSQPLAWRLALEQ